MKRIAALGWMLTLCLALQSLAETPATQPAPQHGASLTFKVVDANTRQPLAGAKVSGHFEQTKASSETNEAGVAKLEYLSPVRYARFTVSMQGYAPRTVSWSDRTENAVQLPAEHTLALEPATTISGIVLSPDGKPVENADVLLWADTKYDQNESFSVYNEKLKTDSAGKWVYNKAPSRIDSIAIHAEHPDFAHEIYTGNGPQPTLGQLRDGTASITLAAGIKVTGRVLNSAGEPIEGAEVSPGRDRMPSNVTDAVKTDAGGQFSYTAKPGETLPLTITAKGYAPELVTVVPNAQLKPLEIKLVAGKTLTVRIVDRDGKPLEGVWVCPDAWRGCRTLEMRLTSDAEGKVVWKDAPTDAIAYDILKGGFADLRQFSMTARDEEYVITLKAPTQVRGSVVDAVTGQPIARFKVIKGISFSKDQPVYWQNREPIAGSDGKFGYSQSYPYPGHAVRVMADGYATADSRIFTNDEAEVTLDFKLTPAKPLAGVVLLPDGAPAGGAEICVSSGPNLMLENGKVPEHYRREILSWTCDPEGRFTIPTQPAPALVIVLHDGGFAELKSDQITEKIQLQAWASVEGTAYIGSKPAANAKIGGWSSRQYKENEPNLHVQNDTTADAEGRFKLDRVVPGKIGVGRYLQLSENTSTYTHAVPLDLKPGERQTIQIGGKGRPVLGRIQLPAELASGGVWKPGDASMSTQETYPQAPRPDNWEEMEVEARQKWYADWQKSPEGQKYQQEIETIQARRKYYPVPLASDGSFRVEDVEPGTYALSISLERPRSDSTCGVGEPLARGAAEVVVPDMPGGRSDEPLEIPTVPMTMIRTLKVGDAAPTFDVPGLDGKNIKLEDFRGKYVLIDFWATWCGPCVAETPHLMDAWNAFGANDKFAMIALSLDDKMDAPKKYVEKKQIPWKQGFLGEWSKTTLPGEYGINGIPSIWLIGPDGKVLARDLRGAGIRQEIAKHLGG